MQQSRGCVCCVLVLWPWFVLCCHAFTEDPMPRSASYTKIHSCAGKVVSPNDCHTVITAGSAGLCGARCTVDPQCLGFVWKRSSGECRHCSVWPKSDCSNTVAEDGAVGFGMDNPCLNNGTVNSNTGECQCTTAIMGSRCQIRIADCQDVYLAGKTTDGNYDIHPLRSPAAFKVHCQIKENYQRTYFMFRDRDNNFYRTWDEYRDGFGSLNSNHWLGLHKMHAITNSYLYRVTFQLTFEPSNYRQQTYHDTVIAGPEDNYAFTFTYTAPHPNPNRLLGDCLSPANGSAFSTRDQDHDGDAGINCAQHYHSGFWFKGGYCTHCNPTGILTKKLKWSKKDTDVFWFNQSDPNRSPSKVIIFGMRH